MLGSTLHFMINWYYEMVINENIFNQEFKPDYQRCVMGLYTTCAFGDILRMVAFYSTLLINTRKCSGLFPLPFTWIFRDLSKFIFEPMCVDVFRKYLMEKERDKLRYLEYLMQLYIKSFRLEEG